MVVAFWSPIHGAAVSMNMIATALATVFEEEKKILIMQTKFYDNNIIFPFVGTIKKEIEDEFYQDIGIDSLIRCIKTQNMTEKMFDNCTISFNNNYLNVLPGTRLGNHDIYNEEMDKMLPYIIQTAGKYYDIVLIDTNSGMNAITENVLEMSDKVIVNLRQNNRLIRDFFEQYRLPENKVSYVISQYDKDSRFSIKNIRRSFHQIKNENSCVIPYNIEFCDSYNDGRVMKFFSRNYNVNETNFNYEFMKAIKIASQKILKKEIEKKGEGVNGNVS